MTFIGIVGPKGAGKDTIAVYLKDHYGAKIHSHSEILDDILNVLYLPNTRDNAISLVELRKIFGDNYLVNALNHKIEADQGDLKVLTGIRFKNEYDNARNYPNSKIIYVDAPIELRYKYISGRRQRVDDNKTSFEHFQALEKRETEIYIKDLGTQADFKIQNDQTLQYLYGEVDKIMAGLGIQKIS